MRLPDATAGWRDNAASALPSLPSAVNSGRSRCDKAWSALSATGGWPAAAVGDADTAPSGTAQAATSATVCIAGRQRLTS